MGRENHDRLDQILHAEEYLGMTCGSLGNIVTKRPDGGVALVPDPANEGQPKTEKKYCGPDCPTLIAEIKAS